MVDPQRIKDQALLLTRGNPPLAQEAWVFQLKVWNSSPGFVAGWDLYSGFCQGKKTTPVWLNDKAEDVPGARKDPSAMEMQLK